MKRCDLSRLLENSSEAYYWLGFLLADGHFRNGRIRITLAIKDEEHLKKLQKFLNIENIQYYNGQCSISGMDVNIIKYICDKYKILSNKTYNPPNLKSIRSSKFKTALTIGFIDGDGSIGYQFGRKDCILRIKCHSSWLNILNWMFSNKAKINNKGYANVNISNSIDLKRLKRSANRLKLPVLNRKWDKIDLNFTSREEKALTNKILIKDLLRLKYKQKDIANILGMSNSALSLSIKRNNLR